MDWPREQGSAATYSRLFCVDAAGEVMFASTFLGQEQFRLIVLHLPQTGRAMSHFCFSDLELIISGGSQLDNK
jgi:hypothetical protein